MKGGGEASFGIRGCEMCDAGCGCGWRRNGEPEDGGARTVRSTAGGRRCRVNCRGARRGERLIPRLGAWHKRLYIFKIRDHAALAPARTDLFRF
jgi:hypothetical protein